MPCSNFFCFSISRHSQYKWYKGNLAPISSFSSIAHLLFLRAAVKDVCLVLSTLIVFIASTSEIFNFQLFFLCFYFLFVCWIISLLHFLWFTMIFLSLYGEWPGMNNKIFGQRVAWDE